MAASRGAPCSTSLSWGTPLRCAAERDAALPFHFAPERVKLFASKSKATSADLARNKIQRTFDAVGGQGPPADLAPLVEFGWQEFNGTGSSPIVSRGRRSEADVTFRYGWRPLYTWVHEALLDRVIEEGAAARAAAKLAPGGDTQRPR